jgi:hypothetical protein
MNLKKQKTYGRFLGMIFSGGFRALLVAGLQRVAMAKNTKKCKMKKKSVIFFGPTPRFSAKAGVFLEAKLTSCCRCDG